MLYYFFGLLWNHALGVALSNFIISSTVCLWYFKKGKSHLGKSPVWTSMKRSILHLGSIAFGSFIIGILGFVRAILAFIHVKPNFSHYLLYRGDLRKSIMKKLRKDFA